jgi:hypothetical protein
MIASSLSSLSNQSKGRKEEIETKGNRKQLVQMGEGGEEVKTRPDLKVEIKVKFNHSFSHVEHFVFDNCK